MTIASEVRDLVAMVPDRFKPAVTMAGMGGVGVALYFLFISAPLAEAQDMGTKNEKRLESVEKAIAPIQHDLGVIKNTQSRQDQRIQDVGDSLASIDRKLDILLQRDRASR